MKFCITAYQILRRGIGIPPHGFFVRDDGTLVPVRFGGNPFDEFFRYVVFSKTEARAALGEGITEEMCVAIENSHLPEIADEDVACARRDFHSLRVDQGDETCCHCSVLHGHAYLMGRPVSPAFVSTTQGIFAIMALAHQLPVDTAILPELCKEVLSWQLLPPQHIMNLR